MAYINATLWNDIQVTGATNEKRFSQLGIIDAVKDSTAFVDYIPPSAVEAMAYNLAKRISGSRSFGSTSMSLSPIFYVRYSGRYVYCTRELNA